MKKLDITNQKFGRLLAVKPLRNSSKNRGIIWLFNCDCGNSIEYIALKVKAGMKHSCGCLVRDRMIQMAKDRVMPNFQGNINKLYQRYKLEASKRNYSFDLSKDDFSIMLVENCYYCGDTPKTEHCNRKHKNKESTFIYNGIDRKNNSLGYSKDNCVSCCPTCNRMKMAMTEVEFINQMYKIINNLKKEVKI